MLLQRLHKVCHSTGLLADSDIDTVYGLACLIETLLVDDGVNGYSRLTCLAVTDDKLTLTTTNGNHRVDSLQTCLQRLLHRLAIDNTRCLTVQGHLESVSEVDVALAVNSLSQRINDTAQHVVVDADRGDALGALHHHTLLDA